MGFFSGIKKGFKKMSKISRKGFGTTMQIMAPFTGPAAAAVSGIGNMVGGSVGDSPERNAQKRADFEYARSLADQRAFQDDSVQRRVADARKAGIHPLAALGYQSPSFVPPNIYAGGGESEYGLSEMGQDIGRAVYAAQTEKERKASMATQSNIDSLTVQRLQLENRNLEADLTHKQLRNLQLQRTGAPAFPDVNAIRAVGVSELGQGSLPVGVDNSGGPAATQITNRDGSKTWVPSQTAKNLIEDFLPAEAAWVYNNWYVPWYNEEMARIQKHTVQPLQKWWSGVNSPSRTGNRNVRQYR